MDWFFYSPSTRVGTAGALLKAIPSKRIWRLERTIIDDGETLQEMVRAAELLTSLDVTLRLQNEPEVASRLRVDQASDADRQAYGVLGRAEPAAASIAVVAEISLSEGALSRGYLDIADDVLAGLEEIYRGGVAHSPVTGEVISTKDVARLMDPDQVGCSHLDLRLQCDPRQKAFVSRQLTELPAPFGRYLRVEGDTLLLRARFPPNLSAVEVDAVCAVALEMARFARSGHVRFRERGVWRHAVEGIGAQVADAPADHGEGMFGKIARLLGRSDP